MTALLALALSAANVPTLQSQSRRHEPHAGPRAISVLEWSPGTKPDQLAKTQPVLAPAIVYQNGRYFDASIYMATPTPLALEPGVLYEASRDGIFQGEFIVGAARGGQDDTQSDASWFAVGTWDSADKIAAREAEYKKKEDAKKQTEAALKKELANEDRPRLKHSSPAPPADSGKPSAPPAPAPISKDPQRPASALPPVGAEPEDPNRPKLRRGLAKGGPQIKADKLDVPIYTGAALMARPVMVAVSDAKKSDTENYGYTGSADDRKHLEQEALALIAEQLQLIDQTPTNLIRDNRSAARSATKSAVKIAAKLENIDLRIWDLFGVNQATVMITATRGSVPTQYITLVAGEDAEGKLRTLLFETTAEDRLDVRGRLLPVDAVDAEGDGFAELLLRRVDRNSERFELYRSYGNQLLKLY